MVNVYLDQQTARSAAADLWQSDQLQRLASLNADYAPPPVEPAPQPDTSSSEPLTTPALPSTSPTAPSAAATGVTSPPATAATAPAAIASVQPAPTVSSEPTIDPGQIADSWMRGKIADAWETHAISQVVAGVSQAGAGVQSALADVPKEAQGLVSNYSALPGAQPAQAAAAAPAGIPAPQPTQGQVATVAGGGGTDVEQYIRQSAMAHGIAPETAVRVAQSEGGLTNPVRQSDYVDPSTGQREQSFGPFQLYLGGGLGNAALKAGIDPRDPNQWRQAVDFALDQAAKGGWSPWHGAARAGIGNFEGIGQAVSSAGQAIASAGQTAGTAIGQAVGGPTRLNRTSQFQLGLNDADAYAACGPAAAIAFARAFGRNPTSQEALQLAKQSGWTQGGGMNGVVNEKKLMDAMGVPTTLETTVNWSKITSDAQNGNPVIVSTPGHYFTVDDAKQAQDGSTLYHVGTSGTDLRGGSEWMSAGEIQRRMGTANGALFADHPQASGPSLAEQAAGVVRSVAAPVQQKAQDLLSVVSNLAQPVQQTAQGVIGAVGNVSSAFTSPSPITPEGGGYGAVPPGGQNPLDQFGRGLSNAASGVLGQVNLTDPTRSVIGGNPVAPPNPNMPTTTQLIQRAEEMKNTAIAENNPLRDVPVVGGLTTGIAQAVDPLMYAAGPILGTAAKALPVGAGLAGTLARGAVQGAGYGAIQGAAQPEADVGSVARGAAIGAGLGLAGEGGLATLERALPPTVARASTEGVNPFALHAEPGPDRVPLTVDEAVSHMQDLEARYTANDATIQTLENRLTGPTTGRGSFTGTVVRPPWGVGWTNDALAAAAQQHGVSPYQDLWWEQAGLNTGSAEVRRLSESGLRGTGNVQQTPTQMRAELERLYAEQDQIMQATEHATANGDRTLYRPLAPVSELPFAEYTPPEANAAQPVATATAPVSGRTTAVSGGTTTPAASGSAGTSAPVAGQPASTAAVAPAGGGPVPPVRPPAPPTGSGTLPTGGEPLGPAGRQPGQMGLGIGEQYQQDLLAPSAGNFEPPPVGSDDWWRLADLRRYRATAGPINPEATGVPATNTVGAQNVLPGFPKPVEQPTALDIINEVHRGNVISGASTATHVVVNTLLSPAWSLATRGTADVFGGVTGQLTGGRVGLETGLSRAEGRGLAVGTALAQSGEAFAQALSEFYRDPGRLFNRVDNPVLAGLLKAQAAPGAALHAALQSVAQASVSRMELGAIAADQAAREGLSGQAKIARMAELMNNPTPRMLADAQDVGQRAALRGEAGTLQQRMQSIASIPLIGPTLFPVVRIGSQALAQGIEKSPIGAIGTAFDVGRYGLAKAGLAKPGTPTAGPYAQTAADLTGVGLSRVGGAVTPLADRVINNVAGTALTMWLIQKAQDGTITGNGPTDPRARAMLQSQGWQPHSILTPFGFMDYHVLGPLAIPLSIAGNWHDATYYAKSGASAGDVAGDLVQRVGSYLTDATGLRTIADLYNTIQGNARALPGQLIGSVAAGFVPESAAVRSAVMAFDPNLRRVEPGNMQQVIQQGLPGGTPLIGGRTDLPIRQDVLGRPETNPQQGLGTFLPRMGTGQPDPALTLLAGAGIDLPANAPKSINYSGRQIQLSPDEQQQRQAIFGQRLQQTLAGYLRSTKFQALPSDQQFKALEPVVRAASQYADQRVIAEMPAADRRARMALAPRAYGAGVVPYVAASGGLASIVARQSAADADAAHQRLLQSYQTPLVQQGPIVQQQPAA